MMIVDDEGMGVAHGLVPMALRTRRMFLDRRRMIASRVERMAMLDLLMIMLDDLRIVGRPQRHRGECTGSSARG